MGHKTRYALPIPNREELQLWDDNLIEWSQIIPTLYNAIAKETFHTDNVVRKLAKEATLEKHKHKPSNECINLSSDDECVQEFSFEDAEAASSASKLTQQMPSARFGKTKVHWPLLLTLTDSSWLSDPIMSAYQQLLVDQFRTIMFLDLKSCVKRTSFASRKVAVGYMNLGDCHWIAAKLDMTQNSATIADSLYATFQQAHDAVFARLQVLANTAGHLRTLQRFTVNVPDQRNSNDCGVFACLFQLYMAQSVSVHCAVLNAFSPIIAEYNTKYHIEV
jgi:Ulp1 family protease